jgi:hypothetical protein
MVRHKNNGMKIFRPKRKGFFRTVVICLFVSGFYCLFLNSSNVEEKPLFRLPRLEIRLAVSDSFEVPSNINEFRLARGITLENMFNTYLENCRMLNIQPFQFDEGGDVYRELYKMQLMQLGARKGTGYSEAAAGFLRDVEQQLAGNPEVLAKFKGLFKRGDG